MLWDWKMNSKKIQKINKVLEESLLGRAEKFPPNENQIIAYYISLY